MIIRMDATDGGGGGGGQDVAARLRDEGYRVTRQRRAVWDALRHSRGHVTVEELHEDATHAAPELNVASVYRTLGLLADLGLAREVRLGDGPTRWEVHHPDDEFHLVCRACASVAHHPGDLVGRVRAHITGEHGFVAESVDLVVHGVCAACAAKVDIGGGGDRTCGSGDAGGTGGAEHAGAAPIPPPRLH